MPQHHKIDSHKCDSDNRIGCILDVFLQGTLHTGICINQSAQQMTVLLDNDEQVSLSPGRAVLISKQAYHPTRESLHDFIQLLQGADIQDIDLPEMQGQSLDAILNLYAGDDDLRRFSLYHYLRAHPERFYQKKGGFYSRSEAEFKQYQHERYTQKAREQYLDTVDAYLTGIVESKPNSALTHQVRDQLLSELQALVQGDKCPDLESIIRKVFPDQFRMEAIQTIRKALGDFCETEPLLNQSGLPVSFPDYKFIEPLPDQEAQDCQEAFSIDDSDTLDFDDALSIKRLDEGYLLGIHVSNLADDTPNWEQILNLAQGRISSLYLPSDTIPMLPRQLSEDVYSLKSGSLRPTLSLYASFDQDFRLLGTELKVDQVKILANLSYAEADRLATNQAYAPLHQIASSLKKHRDYTADKTSNRYIYNFKTISDQVQIKIIDTMSPSRAMVEELMIFYNSSLAAYAADSKLPVLYRNVNQFIGMNEQVLNSTAFLSTQPGYHPGIGTEAYLHATSPIRRLVDMINQAQITARLNGTNAAFSQEELEQMISGIEKRLLLLKDTYNKSERYWCLKYIDQNLLNNPVQGFLRGFWGEYMKVEILPWGKQVLLLSESSPDEEYFSFVPYYIDWKHQYIKADIL